MIEINEWLIEKWQAHELSNVSNYILLWGVLPPLMKVKETPNSLFISMEVPLSIPIGFSGKEFFNASNRDILQSVWRYTWVDRYPRWFAFCLSIKVQKYRYWFVCRIRSKSTKNVFPASFLITFVHSAFDGTANIVTESNSVNTSAIERSIFRPKCHYC